MHISAVDIISGWRKDAPPQEVTLGVNKSTELWSGDCPEPPASEAVDKSAPSGTVVLQARVIDSSGKVLARWSNWPEPYKFLDLQDPGLSVRIAEDGNSVTVEAKRPVKCVWLDVEGDDTGVEWSDNGVSRSLAYEYGNDMAVPEQSCRLTCSREIRRLFRWLT
jgi:beta-mannosidase